MTAYILKLLDVLQWQDWLYILITVHSFLLSYYFTKVFEESVHLCLYIIVIVVTCEDGRYLFRFLSTAVWPDKFTCALL
jgi:hypothetical protein